MEKAVNSDGLYPFLSGGGEMGARMRAHPWEATPMGSPATWPQSLRSMISVCLNSPMLGTILWGPDLRTLYNDAFIPSMADRHPSALGRPVADVWGSSWTMFAEQFFHAMETGEGFARTAVEVPIERHGKTETTYWDMTAAPIRGEDGSIVGLLNQGTDVTERVLADRAARESDERLQQALSAGNGIGTWDWNVVTDRVRSDNRFARLYGVPDDVAREGAPLKHFFRQIHPDDLPAVEVAIAEALRTGHVFAQEYRLVDADGRVRWVLAQGQCERSDDGTPLRFPGVSFDITERKQLEEALGALNADLEQRVRERTDDLEKAQEALRQSQKMEAVGQLTGGIAHDFNNLLQGITGSLQIAGRRLAQGRTDDLERFMMNAITSANRAAALTHRLLAFARRQPLDPQPVQANLLIASLEELFRRTIGETINLKIIAAPGLWTTLCDPNQLESSLLNLTINARDAMPGGGSLIIKTSNVQVPPEEASTAFDPRAGDYISIEVADTGVGMSKETMEHAFEPFYTTKALGQGTGLGLSMVYGFAGQSQGYVAVESVIGVGTTITLSLPRYPGVIEPSAAVAIADVVDDHRAGTGETVLVIEDEDVVRELVVELLTETGCEVIQATNGYQGLTILQSDRPVDLLITDIGLPGLNGRAVAEAARLIRPGLKILFMTGYAENAALATGFLDHRMAMVTKPIAIDALASRIHEMMDMP